MMYSKSALFRAGVFTLLIFSLSFCQPNSKPVDNGDKDSQEVEKDKSVENEEEATTKKVVSIFLENSGSMDGYLNPDSEFKRAVNRICRDAELDFEIKSFYINTKKYPSNRTLSEFLSNLNVKGYRPPDKTFGSGHSSDLNFMFTKAVEEAKNSGLSILISDGIYSLENISELKRLKEVLQSEKLATRNALIKAIIGTDFQTHLIQLGSNYNGRYYTVSNKNFNISDKERPYYIWVFGKGALVQEFLDKIKPIELPGYLNSASFFIIPESGYNYSILPTGPGNIGRFQRVNYQSAFIHEIEDTEPSRANNRFGFNLVIDLKTHLPLEDDFLNDINNYEVISSQNAYSISRIVSAEDFDTRTITSLKALNQSNFKPSHNFYLEVDEKLRLGEIQLNLRYISPSWIKESSTYDDSKYNTKTLGFDILMDAFVEAYNKLNDTKYLATTKLKVNK